MALWNILLLAAVGISSVRAACDVMGFQNCMTPFTQYSSQAQVGITWTEAQLDEVCGVFAGVSACATPKISSCGRETVGVWDSVRDGFNYLCQDPGKSKYLMHQECFANPSLNQKMLTCNRTLTAESQAAARGDRNKILSRTCTAINKFVGCTVGYTRDDCGRDAADFQLTLVSKLVEGTLRLISCSLRVTVDSAQAGNTNSANIPSGGSLTVIIGLLILTLFKQQ